MKAKSTKPTSRATSTKKAAAKKKPKTFYEAMNLYFSESNNFYQNQSLVDTFKYMTGFVQEERIPIGVADWLCADLLRLQNLGDKKTLNAVIFYDSPKSREAVVDGRG